MVHLRNSFLAAFFMVFGIAHYAQALHAPTQYALLLNIELQMMPTVVVPTWEVAEEEDALIITLHDFKGVDAVLFDLAHQSLTLTSPQEVYEIGLTEGAEGYMLGLYFCQQDFWVNDSEDEEENYNVVIEDVPLKASFELSQALMEYDQEAETMVITAPASELRHNAELDAKEAAVAPQEPVVESEKNMLAK